MNLKVMYSDLPYYKYLLEDDEGTFEPLRKIKKRAYFHAGYVFGNKMGSTSRYLKRKAYAPKYHG